jgi:hypothetical protein
VWRTQPAIVTPVTTTVSMPCALRKLDRYVPWKALARFLTITFYLPPISSVEVAAIE